VQLKIEVDTDACVGAGQCMLAAPDVFDQRVTDGVVQLLAPAPPEARLAAVREAAHLCPAGAITIA